jgi:hypothetical protein
MLKTTAIIAIVAARTPMAILAPVEMPSPGVGGGAMEELDVVDEFMDDVAVDKDGLKIWAELVSNCKVPGVLEASDVAELAAAVDLTSVVELAAATVLDVNLTGASASKTPPV